MWQAPLPAFQDRTAVIKEWLAECQSLEHGHHQCKPQDPARLLPTRLLDLDIATGSGQDLKLVHTADLDPTTNYTTLSHCWGPLVVLPPIHTTKSQIDEFCAIIPFLSLPQNFRDAVTLTRMLNIRYLWIDSLCIVQDDIGDWQVEAARMASYYQNGYLTIGAAASAHCYGGFIKELEPSLYSPYTVGSDSHGTARMRKATAGENLRLRFDDRGNLTQNPLLQRAWVLQEQVLSPRAVFFFGSNQMYWQCRNFFASEDGTLQVHRLSLMWWDMERPFDMSDPKLAHSLWWHLVTDYSLRRLTYATDRGPAIAGLVEFYRKHTGHTPLLGLWKETLCFDLCWELVNRKSAYRNDSLDFITAQEHGSQFPSWSWLSSIGADSDVEVRMWLNPAQVEAGGFATELEVLSAETTWHASPFTSGLRSAKLEVRGLTMNAVLGEPVKDQFYDYKGLLVALELSDKPEAPHPKWNPPRNVSLDRCLDQSSSRAVILLHLHQEIELKDLLHSLDGMFGIPRAKTCFVKDTYLCLRQCPEDPTKHQRLGVSQETSFLPWDEGVTAFGNAILGGWCREENRCVLELV